MKILHIGKFYPPFHGGIENFMCALMEQQVKDNHEVSALVHHHIKKQAFTKESVNGVDVYKSRLIGQLLYAPISPLFIFHLYKIIKKIKPDIIHIHTPNLSAFWGLFLSSARKIPWVIQWQSDVIGAVPDFKVKLVYPFYRLFENALIKKSCKIIVATPPYAQTSIPLVGYTDKISVIPLAISCDNISVIGENKSSSSAINLLMIGRLTYYKGHKLIIDALAELKKQGMNFNLTIVGGGELESTIEQQIKSLQLKDKVTLLGKLSDEQLASEMQNTDLLCLPSIERTEAFGVVLLEAMRASKPCLVTDVHGSGMSWVVQDNKTGFVVQHNNVESLISKLAYISEHPELLPMYGNAGRERFKAVFSIEAVSNKVTALYKEIQLKLTK